jgi:hypothetical protein
MLFHDGNMDCIAGRQASILQNNLFCALHRLAIYRENLIDNAQQRIESRLDCIPAIDGDVAVKYLLENFSIRRQFLASSYKFFQRALGLDFIWVSCTHKVHRDVGVYKNHGRVPAP